MNKWGFSCVPETYAEAFHDVHTAQTIDKAREELQQLNVFRWFCLFKFSETCFLATSCSSCFILDILSIQVQIYKKMHLRTLAFGAIHLCPQVQYTALAGARSNLGQIDVKSQKTTPKATTKDVLRHSTPATSTMGL